LVKQESQKPAPGKYTVELSQLDAQWLLHQLGKYFESPELQRVEKEVLTILKSKSNMECEARLIGLLQQDKIELIKLLVKNRFRIYYGVKFAQATQDKEKEALAEELKKIPDGEEILTQLMLHLSKTKTSAKWLKRSWTSASSNQESQKKKTLS
jgi:pre-mRNA-splicing helicase BRR2